MVRSEPMVVDAVPTCCSGQHETAEISRGHKNAFTRRKTAACSFKGYLYVVNYVTYIFYISQIEAYITDRHTTVSTLMHLHVYVVLSVSVTLHERWCVSSHLFHCASNARLRTQGCYHMRSPLVSPVLRNAHGFQRWGGLMKTAVGYFLPDRGSTSAKS